MEQSTHRTLTLRHLIAVLLAISFLALQSAVAADNSPEREQLASLERQLDMIDRLVDHAASIAPQDRARYHFDYAQLREDVKRVHAGVQDYLVPQRAQPRDLIPLASDYVRSDDKEEPSP